MALYFLHLDECGSLTTDEEGNDFPDLPAARRAAILGVRSILADEIREGRLPLDCHIDITDEAGSLVERLPFRDAVSM